MQYHPTCYCLDGLLGHRFVLLTDTGRVSCLPPQTVLKVVRCDQGSGAVVVASGWGEKSDWVRIITADPQVQIQIASRDYPEDTPLLSQDKVAEELLDNHKCNLHDLSRTIARWQ